MNDYDLARLCLAVVALLGTALIGGLLLNRLYLPRVIGEILGGLVLGPTFLGLMWPDLHEWLFVGGQHQSSVLEFMHWLGLVLLMFISGFRVQQHLTRDDGAAIALILFAATVPPFIFGWLASDLFDFSSFMGKGTPPLAFRIVFAVSVTVTSIPVISKIFIDLGFMETRFAKIILGFATIQDLLLWAALAVATGIATGGEKLVVAIDWLDVLEKIGITLGFFVATLSIVRVAMLRTAKALPRGSGKGPSGTGIVLGVCFVFSSLASALGINVVFGALVAGIIVGSMPQASFSRIKTRIEEVSLGFFVPIYFALVGLRLDLINSFDIKFTLLFVLGSTGVVVIPLMLAGSLLRKTLLSSINLCMAVNTRGGPGIVLASIALSFGIIDKSLFVTLVVAAVVTSAISGAWFRMIKIRRLPLYE